MNPEIANSPVITESGVRRRVRSWVQAFRDAGDRIEEWFIPTRRNSQGEKERDKSLMAWRAAVTSFLITITTLVGMLMQRIGPTDNSQVQNAVVQLGNRMSHMETVVQDLTIEVKVVKGLVDGMKRSPRS